MKRILAGIGIGYGDLLLVAARMCALGTGFALTLVVARRLGASGAGVFGFVVQTATFMSAIGLGGIDIGLMRHFAGDASTRRPIPRKLAIRLGMGVLCGSIIIGFVFSLFVQTQPRLHAEKETTILLFAIILQTLGRLLNGFVQAQGKMLVGIFSQSAITQAFTISTLLTLSAPSVSMALLAMLAGLTSTCLFLAIKVRPNIGNDNDGDLSLLGFLRTGLPTAVAGWVTSASDWLPFVIIVDYLGNREAGIFRVAVQLGLPVSAMYSSAVLSRLPRLASAARHPDKSHIIWQTFLAGCLAVTICLPVCTFILVFIDPILEWMGKDFSHAYYLIYIILFSKMINVLTGPTGYALQFMGRGKAVALFSLCRLIIIGVFIPLFAHDGLMAIGEIVISGEIFQNLAQLIYFLLIKIKS